MNRALAEKILAATTPTVPTRNVGVQLTPTEFNAMELAIALDEEDGLSFDLDLWISTNTLHTYPETGLLNQGRHDQGFDMTVLFQ